MSGLGGASPRGVAGVSIAVKRWENVLGGTGSASEQTPSAISKLLRTERRSEYLAVRPRFGVSVIEVVWSTECKVKAAWLVGDVIPRTRR